MYHLVSQSAPTRITKRQMRAKFLWHCSSVHKEKAQKTKKHSGTVNCGPLVGDNMWSCQQLPTRVEDEGSMFLWNAGEHQQDHMASQPKRSPVTSSLPWESSRSATFRQSLWTLLLVTKYEVDI
jgi:hypothetical protein